jgi:hypothetical protein
MMRGVEDEDSFPAEDRSALRHSDVVNTILRHMANTCGESTPGRVKDERWREVQPYAFERSRHL